MKIILLRDIPQLGHKDDIKNVADGYAFHFLIPRGMAVKATAKNLAQHKNIKKATTQKIEQESETYEALRQALEGKTIAIYKPADAKGNLYARVNAKDILQALRALKIPLPARLQENHIIINAQIKTAGECPAVIKHQNGDIAIVIRVEPRAK